MSESDDAGGCLFFIVITALVMLIGGCMKVNEISSTLKEIRDRLPMPHPEKP